MIARLERAHGVPFTVSRRYARAIPPAARGASPPTLRRARGMIGAHAFEKVRGRQFDMFSHGLACLARITVANGGQDPPMVLDDHARSELRDRTTPALQQEALDRGQDDLENRVVAGFGQGRMKVHVGPDNNLG